MKLSKRILMSGVLRGLLCWLGSLYIRFVHLTTSWQVVRGDIPVQFWDSGKPFIICIWHGRFLLMPYVWRRDKPVHMLISAHRDGQLISRTIGHFGITTIEGSSSRGGAVALKRMMGALKAGEYVSITPDGPRGPRMRASEGVVAMARLSGVPVIPATYSVSRRKIMGSWDRFLLALPFGRGVFVWGEPIEVARDADDAAQEAARLRIESGLNAVCDEADGLMGHPPIAPADISDGQQGAAS